MEKVMESHGILGSQTCTNPAWFHVHENLNELNFSHTECILPATQQYKKTLGVQRMLGQKDVVLNLGVIT